MSMRMLVMAVCGVAAWFQGVRADTPEPGSGSAAASAADATNQEKADAATDALRTQPQVPTVRGGTLGIPSVPGTDSLQAIVSGQPASTGPASAQLPDKIGFDVFARLGGLQLFDSFTIDILAESYKQSLPHVDLASRPVLPRMTLTELRDIGFRARWSTDRETKVSVIKRQAAEAPELGADLISSVVGQFVRHHQVTVIAGVRFLQRFDPAHDTLDFNGAASELIGQYTLDHVDDDKVCKNQQLTTARESVVSAAERLSRLPVPAGTAAEVAATRQVLAVANEKANAANTSLVGPDPDDDTIAKVQKDLDVVARQTDRLASIAASAASAPPVAGPANAPIAAEVALVRDKVNESMRSLGQAGASCKTGGYGLTLFAGVSGTMLHTQKLTDDTQHTEDPLFKELRLTAGGDMRTTFTSVGSTLLPRVGAYASLSRGWWHDRFAVSGGKDIDAYQFEAALYVSGHLFGGLDAVVSLVALKPYGEDNFDFLINVAPAIGAALRGK